MMKTFKWLFMAVALWIHANASAEAAIIFVGSWDLANLSPAYQAAVQPINYTAQEAAAVLFGGTAADYMISTIDANPSNINNRAWVDGFNSSLLNTSTSAVNFKGDAGSLGYQTFGDFSALVQDNAPGLLPVARVNFAFINSVAAVPEPASVVLLGIGSLAMVMRRMRRRNSVVD